MSTPAPDTRPDPLRVMPHTGAYCTAPPLVQRHLAANADASTAGGQGVGGPRQTRGGVLSAAKPGPGPRTAGQHPQRAPGRIALHLRRVFAADLARLRAGGDGVATWIEETVPDGTGKTPPFGPTSTRGHPHDIEERRMA